MTATSTALAASAAGGDGFYPPGLEEFFPAGIFFVGTPFEMNRIVLVRILAVAVLLLLFYIGLRKARRVPTRRQGLVELAVGFVKTNFADDVLGEHVGRRYMPLLTGTFFGILAMNLTGIIPALNIASTSIFIMPLTFALAVYVAFIYAGIKKHGGFSFFRNQLFLPGVPWPMHFILAPVELINVFIVRPLSLSLRLMLNMLVGHLLMVLCFSATHFFFVTGEDLGILSVFGVVTLAAGVVMTLFEFVIAILQAYVFTLLTAVYIQQSVAEEH
ncbi:F0F1 ATP synthase subunit A [Marisediminicola sp. LYQ134]|uniref:F0F1 ATP synthase subunit A n=1 Tax=Marisediminicola sp. LYQ134 TaxID=3391061 RepID=UPI003983CE99